nr:mevalonate kinase [Bacteroidota bacterium]
MKAKEGAFYAKILLFGEYSIMCDSMALTIPYSHFQGELSFIHEDKYTDQEFAEESSQSLRDFYNYLHNINERGEMFFEFDLNRLKLDIELGMYFESSIPQGFGIGSSGALVAAVYEKYAVNRILPDSSIPSEKLQQLKKIFSKMESFFHGVSSGMDPLNCYIRNPLLIKPDSSIKPVGIPREFSKSGGIFLINTGKPGKTGPLVNLFFEKCKEDEFFNRVKNEMIPFTNQSIEAILKDDFKEFFSKLRSLSGFLLSNLKPMIPEAYHSIWQHGLDTGTYYLKLCGSGGGGFLLGFTEDIKAARQMLKSRDVEIITVS